LLDVIWFTEYVMTQDHEVSLWTVEAAQIAAKNGQLRQWVIDFLDSPAGKNSKFAEDLRKNPSWVFDAPIKFPLQELTPISGQPEDNRLFHDSHWDDNVSAMVEAIASGWCPPPLIVTSNLGIPNGISDGNHRWSALRETGHTEYWTIFYYPNPSKPS